MSKVKNEPKYKNGLLQAIRAQLEHRAFWLYLLCDEAAKRGLDPRDFGSAAVRRCGLSQGADLVKKGNTDSLKGLKKTLFTKPAQLVFEMDVLESTDDTLNIDFHYCPLVKAWQKAGCSDEEIAMLCDIAMCGDNGIGERAGPAQMHCQGRRCLLPALSQKAITDTDWPGMRADASPAFCAASGTNRKVFANGG